jgi:hypothetical protein
MIHKLQQKKVAPSSNGFGDEDILKESFDFPHDKKWRGNDPVLFNQSDEEDNGKRRMLKR